MLVASVTTMNGIGGTNSSTYQYEGLKFHAKGLGSLGFAKMTVTDNATGIVTESAYNQYWDQRTQGELGHSQTVAPNGVCAGGEVHLLGVDLPGRANGGPALLLPLLATVGDDEEGPERGRSGHGDGEHHLRRLWFRDEPDAHHHAWLEQLVRDHHQRYTHDTANWMLGRLNTASVTHIAPGTPSLVRNSSFTYDPATGLLLSETIEPGNALSTTKTYVRNGFGAVTSLTESWASDGSVTTAAGAPIASRTTSYTYDPYVRYHLTETNPLGQTQTNTYDPLHGLPLTTTGPNGLTTQWTYNAWGQVTQELRADGTKTKNYRYNCTTIVCPANAVYALVTVADGAPVSAVYKDILHRSLRKSVQGFDGRLVNGDAVYDGQGRVLQQSEPAIEGTTQYWTSVQYDCSAGPRSRQSPTTRPRP